MRQLWWMCSGDHVGCVDGHTANSQNQFYALAKAISKKHRKMNPECGSTTLTVAATKKSLMEKNATRTFAEIKHDR